MVKLGIIGLGHMGGYHASVTRTIARAHLVGAADPSPALWQKVQPSLTLTTQNYCDWIDTVDAVIVAVPTAFHYEIAKDCLERGIHVLIEKPLTKNLAQAQELFELATRKNRALHVGHVERFNGAVQELKKIINKPYLIESHRMGPFSPRVQADTVILDLMIHDLDIILNLINTPVVQINCLGKAIHSPQCDLSVVQIEFASGTVATLTSSRASQIKQRSMAIHQADAYLALDFTTQDLSIHRHASSSVRVGSDELHYRQESLVERIFVYKENPLKLEIEHFIDAIISGKNMMQPEQDLAALSLTLDLENTLRQRLL